MPVSGKSLALNAATVRKGKIIIELLDADKKPLPGFAKADCIPFEGDAKQGVIRWKGGLAPSVNEARIRVYLEHATLYGFEWIDKA